MSLTAIPTGFQAAPVVQAFAAVTAERDAMFQALQQIAATDSRYGLQMKEVAADAVREILEARRQARINERRVV